MAHPPLQPRRGLREAGAGDQAPDPGRGEARLESASTRGHIELRLRQLAQLFHSLDPSPFRERDLDVTAEEFIADWASDYPAHQELELVVHLEETRRESREELDGAVAEAVHNHFGYRAERKRREFRDLMARGRTSLAIGLVFYAACFLVGQFIGGLSSDSLAQLGRESLLIGGWVALWRPLEIFLYDSWSVRRQQRRLERLARMTVRVECPRG